MSGMQDSSNRAKKQGILGLRKRKKATRDNSSMVYTMVREN